jgi:hypothetical protein
MSYTSNASRSGSHTSASVVGICPDCQTPEEHVEAEINLATLDYFRDEHGRMVGRPKRVDACVACEQDTNTGLFLHGEPEWVVAALMQIASQDTAQNARSGLAVLAPEAHRTTPRPAANRSTKPAFRAVGRHERICADLRAEAGSAG